MKEEGKKYNRNKKEREENRKKEDSKILKKEMT